jgi:regulator of protease activity HflC (stomatin/prohibitin superfamily)
VHNAYLEKKMGSDVAFSKMIQDARAERESHVDADAAATQSAVEKEEKAYDERQRAKAEADEAARAGGTAPAK